MERKLCARVKRSLNKYSIILIVKARNGCEVNKRECVKTWVQGRPEGGEHRLEAFMHVTEGLIMLVHNKIGILQVDLETIAVPSQAQFNVWTVLACLVHRVRKK